MIVHKLFTVIVSCQTAFEMIGFILLLNLDKKTSIVLLKLEKYLKKKLVTFAPVLLIDFNPSIFVTLLKGLNICGNIYLVTSIVWEIFGGKTLISTQSTTLSNRFKLSSFLGYSQKYYIAKLGYSHKYDITKTISGQLQA